MFPLRREEEEALKMFININLPAHLDWSKNKHTYPRSLSNTPGKTEFNLEVRGTDKNSVLLWKDTVYLLFVARDVS